MNTRSPPQTVLVIDDDAIMRLMASEALGEAGYRVVEAETAEAGWAIFEDQGADLVLLDVMLPGMNGFEACARLRTHRSGANVPIIVMTGLDDRQSIIDAYESGATDFITKPIVWDLLPYRVRYALRAAAALQETARSRSLLHRSEAIASMGSWEWTRRTDTLVWSDEMHHIHGTESTGIAMSGTDLLAPVHAHDRGQVEGALDQAQRAGRSYAIEFRIVRPDGAVRRVFEQTDIERDDSGQVRVVRGIRRDITEQSEASERIRRLAYFDTLTGLANRALFHDKLRQWLPRAAADGLISAVVVLDIDRFKLINETLSELVGDAVLRTVAERLRQGLDSAHAQGLCRVAVGEEHLARLGGNEFTILLADVGSPLIADKVAGCLLDTLRTPIIVDSHELNVSASIGISLAPVDGTDTDTLLRNAISAMHSAKRDTLQRVRFYDGAMSAASSRRLSVESDLRRAVPQGQLQVFYQPKVETRDSRLVGAEALLRWEHPTRGVVGPNEFIPVAEESGLIVPITRWVIGDVCRQIAEWRAQGHITVPVSINLDATSLQNDGLVEVVQSALAESGLDPTHIEFEVTESSLMRDHQRASRTLHQLRDIGMRLSIDDFGTGYSSLTYLKRFPVNVLKIDRSFIQDLLTDPSDAALTTAIIAMAKSLNLSLVAEGVETWEQADFLALRGCHTVQGYLFAKPLPAASFAALLRDGLRTRRPAGEAPSA